MGLIALVGLLAGGGAVYQYVASGNDERRFPPPGELVDVGGHRLHLLASGEAGPTVVLEAGLGGISLVWHEVQAEASRFARVYSYDRGGMGWSDEGPLPRDCRQISKELHTLLEGKSVPRPYILVGHSLGGTFVRAFAQEYPSEVAGVILVDASHEDQGSVLPSTTKGEWSKVRRLTRLGQYLAPLGVLRGFVVKPDPKFHPSVRDAARALYCRTPAVSALYAEMLGIKAGEAEVRGRSLGGTPLLVLAAGHPDALPISGLTKEARDEYRAAAWRLQSDLAARSSNSVLVMVTNSGHGIPFEAPAAIVEGIRLVAEAVKTQRPLQSVHREARP